MSTTERFGAVATHFSQEADYWDAAYARTDVTSLMYQQRQALALGWVDSLHLPSGAHALDLGTGAGKAAIGLAQRGLQVEAVDGAQAMADLAQHNAAAAGFGQRVHAATGDAHNLSFVDGSFDLVLALGILPWVQNSKVVLAEMARVVKPGGYVITSTANRGRLTFRLDPLHSQDIQIVKRPIRRLLERVGLWPTLGPEPNLQSLAETDAQVVGVGLERLAGLTLGFGPFTLLGKRLLPERVEVALHQRLQHLADDGVVGVRCWGVDYLFLARKQP